MAQEAGGGKWLRRYWPRLLLVIPLLLVVWVPFYNRVEPTLADVPFFYWYQLASILIGAMTVLIVYLIERRIARAEDGAKAELESSGTPGDIL